MYELNNATQNNILAGWEALIKTSDWNMAYQAQYSGGRSTRLYPSSIPLPAPGAWKVDDICDLGYGHEVEQLVIFNPEDLHPTEGEWAHERAADVDRYAGWLQEGLAPPPIVVVEHVKGHFVITNGHRRWAAAKKVGKTVPAWVSYSFRMRQTHQSEEQAGVVGLTWELALLDAHYNGISVPRADLVRALTGMSPATRRFLGHWRPEVLSLALELGTLTEDLVMYLAKEGPTRDYYVPADVLERLGLSVEREMVAV